MKNNELKIVFDNDWRIQFKDTIEVNYPEKWNFEDKKEAFMSEIDDLKYESWFKSFLILFKEDQNEEEEELKVPFDSMTSSDVIEMLLNEEIKFDKSLKERIKSEDFNSSQNVKEDTNDSKSFFKTDEDRIKEYNDEMYSDIIYQIDEDLKEIEKNEQEFFNNWFIKEETIEQKKDKFWFKRLFNHIQSELINIWDRIEEYYESKLSDEDKKQRQKNFENDYIRWIRPLKQKYLVEETFKWLFTIYNVATKEVFSYNLKFKWLDKKSLNFFLRSYKWNNPKSFLRQVEKSINLSKMFNR